MAIINPSDVRNLFATAIATAYARGVAYKLDNNTLKLLCDALAVGFQGSSSVGDQAFSYFQTEGRPQNSGGLSNTTYTNFESNIISIFKSNYNLTAYQANVLGLTAQALIFAYTLNTAINISDFLQILGAVSQQISNNILNISIFSIDSVSKNVITPFQTTDILNLLQNDYTQVLNDINSAAKDIEVPLANYNWYDVSNILKEPDLQIMKDVENQYYYLSGQLIYKNAYGTLDSCIEDNVSINTATGIATFNYIRNTPCVEQDSYIGPVNYTVFNRIFNDGPSSSGYFTGSIEQFYVENDQNVLSISDYSSNNNNLYTYGGTNLLSNVFIDANGPYNLSGEYEGVVPLTYGCLVPYQRMHIGDNKPRIFCSPPPDCSCSSQNVTGFKFALVSLPDTIWTQNLQFEETNPLSNNDRMLDRALNLNINPYLATPTDNILNSYFVDQNNNINWYIGYPQLSGGNTLPFLAFFQTFDSPTFGDSASVAIYPALGQSFGNGGPQSLREYQTSSYLLFSGSKGQPVTFDVKISSNLSGQDNISQQFFGMGDGFSGLYTIQTYNESNAGFQYTGFLVSINGTIVDIKDVINDYGTNIIGGTYKYINYISGYLNNNTNESIGLTNFFAQDDTGNLYTYQYLNPSDIPQVIFPTNNWSYFAPEPAILQNNPQFSKIYATQKVENYWPRYTNGPFSNENRKFLYPNMQMADKIYQGKKNGVPTGIKFKISVKEETVREIYGKYTIYPDASITENPAYINVIRSDVINTGFRNKNPVMTNLFKPDTFLDVYDYNLASFLPDKTFNTYSAMGNLVDNNWAPNYGGINNYVPSGKNSVVYNQAIDGNTVFSNGIRITGDFGQSYHYVDKNGVNNFIYSTPPISVGLYHIYNYFETTGVLAYVDPIFNLGTNSLYPATGWNMAFQDVEFMSSVVTTFANFQGAPENVITGMDSLFFQLVGGRIGQLADQQGGYHSQGIIGDRWNGLSYNNYGFGQEQCDIFGGTVHHNIREPYNDSKLVLYNFGATGGDLWVNGMSFTPYLINRNRNPLPDNYAFNYQIKNKTGLLQTARSGEFLNFNLAQFFPLISRIGSATDEVWYCPSGLILGPFDRDIELGLCASEEIVCYSDLYINSEKISHYYIGNSNCDFNIIRDITIDRTVKSNTNNRTNYTILSVIPAGTTGTININSNFIGDDGFFPPTDPSRLFVGMPKNAFVSLRTHNPLDASIYDQNLYSGEENRLQPFSYVGNGIPKKYSVSYPNGFTDLNGGFEFINYGYSGKLYPEPDATLFNNLFAQYDASGNISYSQNASVENYWKDYALKNKTSINFSGYREGSRIVFTFSNIELYNDIIPYQSYNVISPSGDCFLSGQMGYYAQADNSIFTEGFELNNITQNDLLGDIYNPKYVSEVLSRLSFYQFPSSNLGNAPVLAAPSVMKQRTLISGISGNQSYDYLLKEPPFNYNKLLWAALSDLETLNPGTTMENIPGNDGITFSESTMLFSAAQGQKLSNGLSNPNILKTYAVSNIFQTYDSVATNSSINPAAITSGRGNSVTLSQNQMSGVIAPLGNPLSLIINNLN